jgi:hypothetical protein
MNRRVHLCNKIYQGNSEYPFHSLLPILILMEITTYVSRSRKLSVTAVKMVIMCTHSSLFVVYVSMSLFKIVYVLQLHCVPKSGPKLLRSS